VEQRYFEGKRTLLHWRGKNILHNNFKNFRGARLLLRKAKPAPVVAEMGFIIDIVLPKSNSKVKQPFAILVVSSDQFQTNQRLSIVFLKLMFGIKRKSAAESAVE